jgi:hypothetical protein
VCDFPDMSKLTTLVLVLFGVAGAAVARAEDKPAAAAAGAPPPQMAWEKACESDMKSLCAGETGDVRSCLAKNEKKLSKQCTDHFSAAGYRVAQLCDADFERLCKAEAAAGDLGKCINSKIDKLSEKCRAALVKGSEKQDAKDAAKKEKAAEKAAAKSAAKSAKVAKAPKAP